MLLTLLRPGQQKLGLTKVIIEKSRGWRFLWNRNWNLGRFGNFWGRFLYVFMDKKIFLIADGENIFGTEKSFKKSG